jgi:hypothetical protein
MRVVAVRTQALAALVAITGLDLRSGSSDDAAARAYLAACKPAR